LRAEVRSRFSGWQVRVHSSPDRLGQSARTSIFALATGLATLLLLAVGGSFALGKVFARDLERAAQAANTLAQGGPVKLAPSSIEEIDVVSRAIHDASNKLAERDRDQELLRRELQHRVGNMIAVVQALVIKLARGGLAPDQLKAALSQRLEALARAQELIVRRDWHSVRLREILKQELAAFSENVSIAGPDAVVGGATVQTFALLIHELGTNAVKHGAFRSPEGAVAITLGFARDGDQEIFSLGWEERGTAPAPSERKGFGTQLLDSVFAHAATRRRRAVLAEGFIFELHVPAAAFDIKAVEAPGEA
jgi:two-component sensor histidine kinase